MGRSPIGRKLNHRSSSYWKENCTKNDLGGLLRRFLSFPNSMEVMKQVHDGVYEAHQIGIKMRWMCHAPIPGPTRLADPNRFRGAKPYTRTLYLFFFSIFFQSLTYTCGYTNNFCNNQKSFTYTKELPPEWCPSNSIHIY